jgi:uncharacterized protein
VKIRKRHRASFFLRGWCAWLAAVTATFLPATAAAGSPIEYWRGDMYLRGDSTPIRITISGEPGRRVASLDMPEMLLAWEPLATTDSGDKLDVDMPFGLGRVELSIQPQSMTGHGQVGKDELSLRLRPDAEPPFQREEVTVENDNVQLHGTLVRPRGPGPYPAVILVHGSGDQDRTTWEYRSPADFLTRLGFAALIYDKRGVGQSTGAHWGDDHNFEGLASDVLAWLKMLKARDDIRKNSIGLYGGSQAGWVIYKAAAESPDVRFAVLLATPAVTPMEQAIQHTEFSLRQKGGAESQLVDALAYMRLYAYVVHTGEGWDLLQRSVATAQQQPWAESVFLPKSNPHNGWMGHHEAFDPAPLLGHLKCRVLAMYGEADDLVPFVENAPRLKLFLGQSGAQATILTIPKADHRLELPSGRDQSGRWHWFRIAPEYFSTIQEWLRATEAAER